MSGRGFSSGGIASGQGAKPWFGFDIPARLAWIQAAHLEALVDIQTRAIDAGIAAFSISQAQLFSTIANRPLSPNWLQFREENAAALAQLATSWFHQVATAQGAMLAAIAQALLEQHLQAGGQRPPRASVLAERRQRSVVIKFPDRRRTTGYASGQR